MADVFLSYKKEDIRAAEAVVAGLRAAGFSVWWDDSLTPKTAWDVALEREIAMAATVVVLWTPRSVQSDWVRTEAHYGQDRGKLIPVMREDCSIPIAFMLRQTINLCHWNGEPDDRQWRKLLTWVADLTGTKPGNANIPQALGAAQPNPFRRAVGYLSTGEPIVDGMLVNAATPAATVFRDGETLPVMRIVPKGEFLLGSPLSDPDRGAVEGPQKRIEIPAPFAMGVFPVSGAEYQAIAGAPAAPIAAASAGKARFGRFKQPPADPLATWQRGADPALPVTQVSFEDAQTFVARLSAASHEVYRLPSEAEWEYACRAGSRSRYCFGDVIDATVAAFGRSTGPVKPGSFPPNAFGLYDMHGNVREWTADLWHESYDDVPLDGSPALEGHGSMRVVRGGGWCDDAVLLRSAARMRATYSSRVDAVGFRVVRVLT
ncbi:MAG: SUMF1/EgtB/PvdO family nonheme iron enzyme [Azospirillaceae bacterium]|nr:SUMF1/EgtB/PvdO family nonheme iron enzyme [Azospirillaceae bacterium]